MILHADPGRFFVVIAMVCTSFTTINMATNGRSALTPYGNESYPCVQQGNIFMERNLACNLLPLT